MDYWRRRRDYERINTSPPGRTRRKNAAADTGDPNGSSRKTLQRFFKFAHCRVTLSKLQLRFCRFLPGIRDAYVNMMLRIANASVGGLAGAAVSGFGTCPLKEYDDRMLLHIYTSLLIPRPADQHLGLQEDAPTHSLPIQTLEGFSNFELHPLS